MIKQKQGFTLVELIVVITILAILATIAFISFSGFSAQSRDSARHSDLKTITRVIDIYETTNNLYPDPSNATPVTYSGSEVWSQGDFGDDTRRQLGGKASISDSPIDPITGNKYTYSVLNTKKEYQIGAILEGGLSNNNSILSTTHAGTQEGIAYIKGNYNGAIAKVYSGSIDTTFILAIPSIINSDLQVTDVVDVIENNKLVYQGHNNLPASYSGTTYNVSGSADTILVNTGSLVVYEGNFENLQSASSGDRVAMIEAIQNAYTGTVVETNDVISNILDQTRSEDKTVYSNILVKKTLGGTPPPVVYATCGSSSHGDIKAWYSSETLPFGSNCSSVQQDLTCHNGLWKDGTTTVDTAPLYESCSVIAGSNCTAGSTNGTTYGSISYNYSAVNHTNDTGATGSNSIANGTENYTATATCTNGSIALSSENKTITCDSGYVEDSGACVADQCGGSIPANAISNASTQSFGTNWNYNTSAGTCTFICDTNYTWNGSSCIADTRSQTCGGTQPSNSTLNSGTSYTQTWNGSSWSPTTNYNESASGDCSFECNTNYTYNSGGNTCDANNRSVSCGGSIPANATATTSTTYTQTWNGSSWTPTTSWNISQGTCDFDCNTNYSWNGSTCVADTQTVSCGGSIPANASATTSTTYTQTWNGSSWTPTTSWGESQGTCDFNCNTNYSWNGSSCVGQLEIVGSSYQGGEVIANNTVQFYITGNISFLPPSGFTNADIYVIGGGGASNGDYGTAGAGGGFSFRNIALNNSQNINLTVGEGGSSAGGSGGSSTVSHNGVNFGATGGGGGCGSYGCNTTVPGGCGYGGTTNNCGGEGGKPGGDHAQGGGGGAAGFHGNGYQGRNAASPAHHPKGAGGGGANWNTGGGTGGGAGCNTSPNGITFNGSGQGGTAQCGTHTNAGSGGDASGIFTAAVNAYSRSGRSGGLFGGGGGAGWYSLSYGAPGTIVIEFKN